jgi:CBS domain-containing protein
LIGRFGAIRHFDAIGVLAVKPYDNMTESPMKALPGEALNVRRNHWQAGCKTLVVSFRRLNMRIAEVMSRNVVVVPADATVVEAAELMKNYNIGFLPVVSSNVLVGVLTDRDIVVNAIGRGMNPHLALVRSIMTSKPVWCYEHDVLTDAADILADNHLHRLVVIDSKGKITGLLSIDDLAAHMSSDRLLGIVFRHVAAA